jgi:hypothetical protein
MIERHLYVAVYGSWTCVMTFAVDAQRINDSTKLNSKEVVIPSQA